jgi:hypothetical protein
LSGRLAEKERRREERRERERERRREERRRRILGRFSYVAVGGAIVGVAIAAMFVWGGKQNSSRPAQASGAFGQHYVGLDQCRRAAHVPTMMDTMNSPVHFHPLLKVFVDGKQVPVPAGVGIDPAKDPMQMAGLHTHDASGTIHVEGVAGARLGQFFAVWGVPLSATQIGPYRSAAGKTVQMWVDGKPSTAIGRLKLADGQRIVISYGPRAGAPPGT